MRYAKPEIEVIALNVMDVIRTSSEITTPGENQTPVNPRNSANPADADI